MSSSLPGNPSAAEAYFAARYPGYRITEIRAGDGKFSLIENGLLTSENGGFLWLLCCGVLALFSVMLAPERPRQA